MEIELIPALSDNYIFLLYDPSTQTAAVVDPAQAEPVLACLARLNLKLVAIFNTHHHWDHVGANQELLKHFPRLHIYGSKADQGRIPGQKTFLLEGDRVEFAGRVAEVLFVPGHTSGHIAYYFPPAEEKSPGELFCGDTLFAGGCGRLFEGTPAQMLESLSKLRSLPENTRIWCAHEYTLNNLAFALTVDPDNYDLQKRYADVQEKRKAGISTIPSLLEKEKTTNPFLRWDKPALQKTAQSEDAVTVLGKIRQLKDNY